MNSPACPIPQSAGYVMAFAGHGAFAPSGRIEPEPDAPAIAAHNASLAAAEVEAMRKTGRGLLYVAGDSMHVTTWDGSRKWTAYNVRTSWHNMAGRNGRTDLDFTFDGSRWHGVNIGDNQIVRCRRVKA